MAKLLPWTVRGYWIRFWADKDQRTGYLGNVVALLIRTGFWGYIILSSYYKRPTIILVMFQAPILVVRVAETAEDPPALTMLQLHRGSMTYRSRDMFCTYSSTFSLPAFWPTTLPSCSVTQGTESHWLAGQAHLHGPWRRGLNWLRPSWRPR